MSNPAASDGQSAQVMFKRLESAVDSALGELRRLRERAEEAESKNVELEELVRRFTHDAGESPRLLSRLEALETQNADLKGRVDKGREGVERLLAKIRFLEEQR